MRSTYGTSQRPAHRRQAVGAVLLSVAAVAALTSCAEEPGKSGGKSGDAITVGLTYTPNIQFAPFYVAEEKGFYKNAGIEVNIRHHGAAEKLFGALKQGKEDVVYAGGDEILQARADKLPIVDIATIYHKYPVALLVPEDSDIRTPADLKGKTLGTPGPFGETYFGLLALLKEGGLTPKDAKVKYISFTQQAALKGHRVDGVMGYVNNDAVAFKESGTPVRAINLSSEGGGQALVGPSLAAKQNTLDKRGDEMRKFVDASLRGMQYTIDHPEEAVKISKKYVPTLRNKKLEENALAVLMATRPLMKNDHGELGAIDPLVWDKMADFMYSQGLLDEQIQAEEAYDGDYLPKS